MKRYKSFYLGGGLEYRLREASERFRRHYASFTVFTSIVFFLTVQGLSASGSGSFQDTVYKFVQHLGAEKAELFAIRTSGFFWVFCLLAALACAVLVAFVVMNFLGEFIYKVSILTQSRPETYFGKLPVKSRRSQLLGILFCFIAFFIYALIDEIIDAIFFATLLGIFFLLGLVCISSGSRHPSKKSVAYGVGTSFVTFVVMFVVVVFFMNVLRDAEKEAFVADFQYCATFAANHPESFADRSETQGTDCAKYVRSLHGKSVKEEANKKSDLVVKSPDPYVIYEIE
jgi:hypothetical protein